MNAVEKLFSGSSVVFFDGAMGTMLQQSGMPKDLRGDIMNIAMPDVVKAIHERYIDAGSDIICTNTFGASAGTLRDSGYTPEQVISAGIRLAKSAAEGRALVAFDMGPIGELLEPSGDLTFGDAYKMFKEQAELAEKHVADLVLVETMGDIEEVRAAVGAVRENTTLPVFATMTFLENMKTYMGTTVKELAELAGEYRVEGVGINCSLPPDKMFRVACALSEATDIPLIVKLNAGMPGTDGSYALTPEQFAQNMLPYRELNVKVVGACCGSTPDFIRELRRMFLL